MYPFLNLDKPPTPSAGQIERLILGITIPAPLSIGGDGVVRRDGVPPGGVVGSRAIDTSAETMVLKIKRKSAGAGFSHDLLILLPRGIGIRTVAFGWLVSHCRWRFFRFCRMQHCQVRACIREGYELSRSHGSPAEPKRVTPGCAASNPTMLRPWAAHCAAGSSGPLEPCGCRSGHRPYRYASLVQANLISPINYLNPATRAASTGRARLVISCRRPVPRSPRRSAGVPLYEGASGAVDCALSGGDPRSALILALPALIPTTHPATRPQTDGRVARLANRHRRNHAREESECRRHLAGHPIYQEEKGAPREKSKIRSLRRTLRGSAHRSWRKVRA